MIRQFTRVGDTVLIIEETSEGFFLYSFPRNGSEGDTWHLSVEDANAQVSHQFGKPDMSWLPVPNEISSLRDYAHSLMS